MFSSRFALTYSLERQCSHMSLHSPPQPKEYDPRIGDEDGSKQDSQDNNEQISPSFPQGPQAFPVAPKPEADSNCHKGKETANRPISSPGASRFGLPGSLNWIIDNWTWSKWQPTIRCAVSEWASLLLLLIGPSRRAMGQVCSSVTCQ